MTHASLFSGIGGFDLAAEWMGWENVFNCEIEPFPRRILNYYFPQAISYEDITKTYFTVHRGRIDVLTGGFPCQPYSTAGKRLGKADSRHLFPEMLRAIKEFQPRWVIGENVRGLVSWNGGLVFDEVCADLEGEGYEVIPFLIPAAGINAPHRRDRIWFVAYKSSERLERTTGESIQESSNGSTWDSITDPDLSRWGQIDKAYAGQSSKQSDSNNFQYNDSDTDCITERTFRESGSTRCILPNWEKFPTVTPICHGDDGLSNRLDSITFPKWRKESIKGGGNAIVPQISYAIFKAIVEYEKK